MTMTTRELREALYHLSNQEMTVRELRALLFKVDDQDAELSIDFCMWLKLENANPAPAETPLGEQIEGD
jgi:hypothetical protein